MIYPPCVYHVYKEEGLYIMRDEYIYPAIFTYEDKGISIEFPDLPGCLPCAESIDDAVKNAREALGLHLYGMEEDGEEIPESTSVWKLKPKEGSIAMLIDVYMPPMRDRIRNHFVKKTLSIPYWLNVEAERKGVNFSGVLQDALKSYLNIQR